MYRLYNNDNMILENEDLEVLRNYITKMGDMEFPKITYVSEDEYGDEIEEIYIENLNCIGICGDNNYIEFAIMGTESGKISSYRVEIKNLEKLGMDTLYNKVDEIKSDLSELYKQYNGFIPKDIVDKLVKEKMN